jgi:SAM-dependent methyltransferase
MANKFNKWQEAYQDADIASACAAGVLQQHAFLLPQSNKQVVKPLHALDLACGRGGNALFLAKQGFVVDAIDLSSNVLDKLKSYALQHDLRINCLLGDVEEAGLPGVDYADKYDVIVVSYFLYRPLFADIIKALKPGGLLFYQTWSQVLVDKDKGPQNPQFRLARGELLKLTKPLVPVFYQEYGVVGDTTQGLRNEALLVAQKVS